MQLSFLLGLSPFFLLLSVVVFLDGSRRPDAIVEWRVLHALDNGLAAGVDLLGVVAPKGGRNGRPVVHPALQLELPHGLVVPVGLGSALGDLVAPHVGLVEVVDKVDGELDQKVSLALGVVGVVEPVVKVSLGPEPQHGVSAVLDPKGLLPLFHHNGAEGDSRQDKSPLSNEFGLWQRRALRSGHLLGEHVAVGIAGVL